MKAKATKTIVKRQRGKDRPRHLSGRYVPIPVRVTARLLRGLSELEGCWLPSGALKADGYKHVYWTDAERIDRTLTSAHLIGRVFHCGGWPMDDDEVPHHKCVNAWCINPEHIEVIRRDEHYRLHALLRRASKRRRAA